MSAILHTVFWLLLGSVPWWGWLLRGVGAGISTLILFRISDNTEDGAWALAWWLVSIMAAVAGIVSFIIALVRFVQWAFS